MNLIQSVKDLAEEVCSDLKYVYLCPETTKHFAKSHISKWRESTSEGLWPKPKFLKNEKEICLYEIIANSVNYCFWYGKSDLRPFGSQATKMYQLLDESWLVLVEARKHNTFTEEHEVKMVVDTFKHKLILERFPLLNDRIRHLNEIEECKGFPYHFDTLPEDPELFISYLIYSFPGYAQDLFLKRALLCVMQINRRAGLFSESILKLPIAADYQLPKMLEHFNCIKYENSLKCKIQNGDLIPEGSREEIEIRAATIVTCSMLAEEAGCTCYDIDSFLWTSRKECNKNFHLTNTSNY